MKKIIIILILPFLSLISFSKKDILIKVKITKQGNITNKNGIYYVGDKPYRGVVYKKKDNIINEVELENYLYSVVSSEMPAYFSYEAIKAQAIASRTYAIYHINKNKNKDFHLYDNTRSQVYGGIKVEQKKIKKAVDETKSYILTYENIPILASYHSSSGNRTKSAKDMFNMDAKYLIEVKDYSYSKQWQYKIDINELEKIFNLGYDKIPYLNKNYIRKKIGGKYIKSTNFKMKKIGNFVYVRGFGFGHGVGLSQWGANYLAKVKKYDYKKILNHYYTNIKIEKLGDNHINE